MNRKNEFFTVKELKQIEKDCDYLFLVGERANGKSYSVKSHTLSQAFKSIHDGICTCQIGYIRRFDLDCRDSMLEPYFADMPIQEITKGLYTHITVYRKKIYFSHLNKDGKIQRDVCIGNCFGLTSAEHYKSLMFPQIYNIIYEEVISETNKYLFNEPQKLQQLISTILRDRNGKVYLIGNTLSRMCPYYKEFGLVNAEDLEQGNTNIYELDDTIIKVHRTALTEHKSKMFFGQSKKNITQGEYLTNIYPHIEEKLSSYDILHTVVLKYESFTYLMRFMKHKSKKYYVWYIEPKTTPIQYYTRVVALEYNSNVYWTRGFLALTWTEEQAFNMLLKQDKVVFSDNLTGTEFYNILKYFK